MELDKRKKKPSRSHGVACDSTALMPLLMHHFHTDRCIHLLTYDYDWAVKYNKQELENTKRWSQKLI